MRPSKKQYYLGIAEAVSKRSTCMRRQYGAVIVKDDEIISTGYNGSPRGEINCISAGYCEREELHIPHGERYELCKSVHAEMNAIISAKRADMNGGTLYLCGLEDGKRIDAKPCMICERLIKNAGLEVVCSEADEQEAEETIYVESYSYKEKCFDFCTLDEFVHMGWNNVSERNGNDFVAFCIGTMEECNEAHEKMISIFKEKYDLQECLSVCLL